MSQSSVDFEQYLIEIEQSLKQANQEDIVGSIQKIISRAREEIQLNASTSRNDSNIIDADAPANVSKDASAVKEVSAPFENSSFGADYQFQNYLFFEFCQKNETSNKKHVKLHKNSIPLLTESSFLESSNIWVPLWNDYVSLHINLRKHTNIPFNLLQQSGLVSFNRASNCKFVNILENNNENEYENVQKLFRYFEQNDSSNHDLEKYYLIWNGFLIMFDNIDNEYAANVKITDMIETELIRNIARMGAIRFEDCNFNNQIRNVNYSRYNILPLFNNNEQALDWILQYVTKNIENTDFGLEYIISHYLTLLLYSLFVNNTNSIECPYKQDLRYLFQLISQFSIYNICFPQQNTLDESFYLQQFAKYAGQNAVGFYPRLSNLYNFNFFDDCTLLDGAMKKGMENYIQTLKSHGFEATKAAKDQFSGDETDVKTLKQQIEILKQEKKDQEMKYLSLARMVSSSIQLLKKQD